MNHEQEKPSEEQTYRKSIEETLNRLEINMKIGFDGIYARQDKTNGNVTRLRIWRGYITGGLAILSIIVLPIAFWVLTQILSVGNGNPQQARAAVFDTQK